MTKEKFSKTELNALEKFLTEALESVKSLEVELTKREGMFAT